MKLAPFSLVILLAPTLTVAAERVAVIDKAKQQMSSEFKYKPSTKADEPEDVTVDENVFLLPAYTVSEARFHRDVERAVLKARREFEAKEFDWKNGGTIKEFKRGGRTIEVGMWPNGAAFTLLQIKW